MQHMIIDINDQFRRNVPVGAVDAIYNEMTETSEDYRLLCETISDEEIQNVEFATENILITEALAFRYKTALKKMDTFVRRINQKMSNNEEQVEVVSHGEMKPVKRSGIVMLPYKIQMNDGQAITALFHVPELETAKGVLPPESRLISFQWKLNRKDITKEVTKITGRDFSALQIASILADLVVKNHKTFTNRQEKANAEKAAIEQLEQDIQDSLKQSEDAFLAAEGARSVLDDSNETVQRLEATVAEKEIRNDELRKRAQEIASAGKTKKPSEAGARGDDGSGQPEPESKTKGDLRYEGQIADKWIADAQDVIAATTNSMVSSEEVHKRADKVRPALQDLTNQGLSLAGEYLEKMEQALMDMKKGEPEGEEELRKGNIEHFFMNDERVGDFMKTMNLSDKIRDLMRSISGEISDIRTLMNGGNLYKELDLAEPLAEALSKIEDVGDGVVIKKNIGSGDASLLLKTALLPLMSNRRDEDDDDKVLDLFKKGLKGYFNEVREIGSPNQVDLFGDTNEVPARSNLISKHFGSMKEMTNDDFIYIAYEGQEDQKWIEDAAYLLSKYNTYRVDVHDMERDVVEIRKILKALEWLSSKSKKDRKKTIKEMMPKMKALLDSVEKQLKGEPEVVEPTPEPEVVEPTPAESGGSKAEAIANEILAGKYNDDPKLMAEKFDEILNEEGMDDLLDDVEEYMDNVFNKAAA